MLSFVAHWILEGICLVIIAAVGQFLLFALANVIGGWFEDRDRDRAAVERAYQAGGWDYLRAGLPVYDSVVAEQIDLMIWETERDIDALTEGES